MNKEFCLADVCVRNDRNFGGNTAGFFITTTHPHRRCCPCRSSSLKTKLQLLDIHPTTVIFFLQTFFFSFTEMGSQFKRLPTGISAVMQEKTIVDLIHVSSKSYMESWEKWQRHWIYCINAEEDYLERNNV